MVSHIIVKVTPDPASQWGGAVWWSECQLSVSPPLFYILTSCETNDDICLCQMHGQIWALLILTISNNT